MKKEHFDLLVESRDRISELCDVLRLIGDTLDNVDRKEELKNFLDRQCREVGMKEFVKTLTEEINRLSQSEIQEIHLPFSNDPLNIRNIGEHALNIVELEVKLNEVIKKFNEITSPKIQL